MNGCCTDECVSVLALPLEEQIELRKEVARRAKELGGDMAVYKSRIRPRLEVKG
jgi:hypothetical protein